MVALRSRVMIPRLVPLGALLWVATLAACGSPNGDRNEEHTGTSSDALSYDCTVTHETGYDQGVPFAIDVVTVAGYPVEIHTADALLTMMAAAEKDGVYLTLNDAFRTNAQQEYYWNCYQCGCCNNGNPAAKPGWSNHQSGHAIDFDMSGNKGSWIFAHAPSFGWSNDEGASVGENWHWDWWGGGSPQAYCSNALPIGYLDKADCEQVTGWAFDAEAGDGAIAAHIYFNGGAGNPSAHGVPLVASQHRDDLCAVVGSCNHGFAMNAPLSLLDGSNHEVHAYGIDSTGGANPELANSPRQLNCTGTLPEGVARWVTHPASYGAWKFDAFQDSLPIAKTIVDSIPRSVDVPAAPVLVTGTGGKVYLVDAWAFG